MLKRTFIFISFILILFCIKCTSTQPVNLQKAEVTDYYIFSKTEFCSVIAKFTLENNGQISGDTGFLYDIFKISNPENYKKVTWSIDQSGYIYISFCDENDCKSTNSIRILNMSNDDNRIPSIYLPYNNKLQYLKFGINDQNSIFPFVKNKTDLDEFLNMKAVLDKRNNEIIEPLLKGFKKEDVYSFTLTKKNNFVKNNNEEFNKYLEAFFNNYENPTIKNQIQLIIDEFAFNAKKEELQRIRQKKYLLIRFDNIESISVNKFNFKKNEYAIDSLDVSFSNYTMNFIPHYSTNSEAKIEYIPFLKFNKSISLKMSEQEGKIFKDNYIISKSDNQVFNEKLEFYILAKVIKTEINKYRDYKCRRINPNDVLSKTYCYSSDEFNYKQVILKPLKIVAIDKTSNEKFVSE